MVFGLPPVPSLDALRAIDLLLDVLNDTEGVGETVQMIDSTIIRAHHCAAGARGGGTPRQGLGRSRGGFSTKIHLRTNGSASL